MKTYKREDKLYSSLAEFLIIGALSKLIVSFTILILALLAFLNYQNQAYDKIIVIAQSENPDSFFSFLDRENVYFNMTYETEDEKIDLKNIKTPYFIKIPKGERIKVELNSDSKFICAKLKSAGSSVAGSLENSMKLERNGKNFKINCPI